MPEVDSLGVAEKQVADELWPKLSAHSSVTEKAFNTVGQALAAPPELPVSQVSLSRKVTTVLLVRLSNDLRAAALLALRGYALQAAALAGSMYEVAYAIAYIGSDESKAEDWVQHSDPTRPFRNVRAVTEDVAKALGVNDAQRAADVQYRFIASCVSRSMQTPYFRKTTVTTSTTTPLSR